MWIRLPTTVSIRTTARRFTAIALLLFNFRAVPCPVLSLATSPGNGDLSVSPVVHISLNISEAVQMTRTPTLSLNDGGTATYVSGSGSNTLIFSYTVQAGQNTPDLAITSVNLSGGTIGNDAGN